jgi:hypothetical protein
MIRARLSLAITGFLGFVHRPVFRKLDVFPSSGEGWETRTLWGPLQRANLKHWTFLKDPSELVSPTPHLRTETDPVSETLCSLKYRMPDKVPKPSNPKWNTPPSEPFKIYVDKSLTTGIFIYESDGGNSNWTFCTSPPQVSRWVWGSRSPVLHRRFERTQCLQLQSLLAMLTFRRWCRSVYIAPQRR